MNEIGGSHQAHRLQSNGNSTVHDIQYQSHPQTMTSPPTHQQNQNVYHQSSPRAPAAQFPSLNALVQQHAQPQQNLFDHPYRPLLPKTGNAVPTNTPLIGHAPVADFFTAPDHRQAYTNTAPLDAATYADWQPQHHLPEETTPAHHTNTPPLPNNTSTYPSPPTQTPHPHPPNRWYQAHAYRLQVHEPPQIEPSTDPTIAQVTHSAEHWVVTLIHAITNTTSVKDTPTSHALRTFLPSAYDPFLIEATARQILTLLLDRCTHGFRGPAAFNKALKPARDLEADRTATCEERMRNVVEVLRWNKRACKDVLYEDWKIRLLVNHPLAYDREKDCQKGSNDQRRKRLVQERERLRGVEEELRGGGGGGGVLRGARRG
ncbi:hypothetical protein CC80DRAFT_548902 [Byssothecium circinans]|uniref:Uncharacterized protein n=1 Tax=Byssothecium circinans TaxID=147558 RepID=A0A6A5TU52_9PLEO|nr:hypothetical protein CC80DRAFT_548902 [Byssothecium circinans]